MQKHLDILKRTRMFAGVGEDEIAGMAHCLGARQRTYRRGEHVLRQGERLDSILVLAAGNLHIQNSDYWGNRSILGHVSVGEMFGEAYAAPESGALMNDVVAIEPSTVIFFDAKRVITTCPSACPFHARVVQNMFFAISEKNRELVQKLGHMSQRSTRDKLISYLSEESKRHNSPSFTVPFNRQQLADFLAINRSAMSSELCKMRDEGMLTFERNRFTLL